MGVAGQGGASTKLGVGGGPGGHLVLHAVLVRVGVDFLEETRHEVRCQPAVAPPRQLRRTEHAVLVGIKLQVVVVDL